jgi:hypothetical protein
VKKLENELVLSNIDENETQNVRGLNNMKWINATKLMNCAKWCIFIKFEVGS